MRGLQAWSARMKQSPQPEEGHTRQSGKPHTKKIIIKIGTQATGMLMILTGEKHC